MSQTASPAGLAPETGGDGRSYRAAENFRAVLNALARPGRIYAAAPYRAAPPPLSPAAAAVLTALSDIDAPYWLAPSLQSTEIEAYARFETSAPPASAPQTADFVVGAWPDLKQHIAQGGLKIGTPEYPDRSATLVVAVDALADAQPGEGALSVSGPGVEDAHLFHAEWLGDDAARQSADDADFLDFLRENNARFPLGVDVILTADDRIVGLPRTARVRREG